LKIKRLLFMLLIAIIFCNNLYAHEGRTDSKGGHKDNKNVSGLGSYHYHCGDYPEHLHKGGVCPYKSTSNSSTKTSNPKPTEKIISVSIGGELSTLNAININNTNLIELRTLCDKLDITIESYDSLLKAISCKKDDIAFMIQIDSKTMWKGTELITLDVAPIMYKGKTMVPARVIAETIGRTVNYNVVTDSIVIE